MASPPERDGVVDWIELAELLNKSFSLAPITQINLFAGRKDQLRDLIVAIATDGQHPIIYGERGVGKTSLANIAVERNAKRPNPISIPINCDSKDKFGTVWKKVFDRVFDENNQAYSYRLDEDPNPEDVRAILEEVGKRSSLLVVLDEFDKYPARHTEQMADTIKTLYDHRVPAKVILVGVADSVGELIKRHASVGRALVEIHMPRMSVDETTELVTKGFDRVSMEVDPVGLRDMVVLSQGLPYYAQLLGLYSGLEAISAKRLRVEHSDVEAAIKTAVGKASETIKRLHHAATSSPRKDNRFSEVLLACALATTDSRGYFAAADVKEPMSKLMGKDYEHSAFAQHLKEFMKKHRGPVLSRIGRPRSYRFRFVEPLLQPYIIMRGLSEGKLQRKDLSAQ